MDEKELMQRAKDIEAYKGVPKRKPIIKGKKTGRNEPCICGSGQKFKKCCYDKRV